MSTTAIHRMDENKDHKKHNIEENKDERAKIHHTNPSTIANAPFKMVKQNDVHVGDENGIYSIALHPMRKQSTIGLGSGVVHVYDTENWSRIRKLRHDFIVSLPLLAVKYYPCLTRDALYTGGSNGVIKIWNLEKFEVEDSIAELGNQITSLDFNNDGSRFATVGKDRCVRIYDCNRNAVSRVYEGTDTIDVDTDSEISVPGHSQKIFAVKYHPDDTNMLISASWDRTLKVWDTRLSTAVRTIHGPYVCGDGIDINQNTVLTASWKQKEALQLWDFRMESLIKNLVFSHPYTDQKGEFLYCGRFWDEHHVIAGGSGSHDLKVINIETNKVVGSVSASGSIQALEVNIRSNVIIFGTSGNCLRTVAVVD